MCDISHCSQCIPSDFTQVWLYNILDCSAVELGWQLPWKNGALLLTDVGKLTEYVNYLEIQTGCPGPLMPELLPTLTAPRHCLVVGMSVS